MPNPCHSDAGGCPAGTVMVVVLFEDSSTLAPFKEGFWIQAETMSSKPRISFKPSRPRFSIGQGLDGAASDTVYRFLHLSAYIRGSFYRGDRDSGTTRVIAFEDGLAITSQTRLVMRPRDFSSHQLASKSGQLTHRQRHTYLWFDHLRPSRTPEVRQLVQNAAKQAQNQLECYWSF